MVRGTAYFVSRGSAYRYFAGYGFGKVDVDNKFACGEIHIGKPPLREGERLQLDTPEGRYHIIEKGVNNG